VIVSIKLVHAWICYRIPSLPYDLGTRPPNINTAVSAVAVIISVPTIELPKKFPIMVEEEIIKVKVKQQSEFR
jgi:hypothetical protein